MFGFCCKVFGMSRLFLRTQGGVDGGDAGVCGGGVAAFSEKAPFAVLTQFAMRGVLGKRADEVFEEHRSRQS